MNQWEPVIDWFNQRYKVNIQPIRDISCTSTDDQIKETLNRHLASFNFPCLQGNDFPFFSYILFRINWFFSTFRIVGILFAVESLKSLILTLCCIDRKISVETAIQLSRLEEEFQVRFILSSMYVCTCI